MIKVIDASVAAVAVVAGYWDQALAAIAFDCFLVWLCICGIFQPWIWGIVERQYDEIDNNKDEGKIVEWIENIEYGKL